MDPRGACKRVLKPLMAWEGPPGKCCCRQPDSGNPTVRDEKGGLGKRGLWWNCDPSPQYRKGGLETLHLKVRARPGSIPTTFANDMALRYQIGADQAGSISVADEVPVERRTILSATGRLLDCWCWPGW